METIASEGAFFQEVKSAAGIPEASASDPLSWIGSLLVSLGQQIVTTLLVGLPRTLGSATICTYCSTWPSPSNVATASDIQREELLSAPFSLMAIALWSLAAAPLLRDTRRSIHSRRGMADKYPRYDVFRDARWWGRAMLVIGGALTLLDYAASRSSYNFPTTSARYLVGLYLCTPLIADPLWRGSQWVWQWLKACRERMLIGQRPRLSAMIALGLLIALVVLDIAGLAKVAQEAANHQAYGVPVSRRDAQVLTFLQQHDATRFYSTYWACYRLMFEAAEQVTCSVVSDQDVFAPGLNRVSSYTAIVAAAPHPAYVFDTLAADFNVSDTLPTDFTQHLADQVGSRLASQDPDFAGYTVARFTGYIVYYYAGMT